MANNEALENVYHLIAIAGVIIAIGSVIGTICTVVVARHIDLQTAKESELQLMQLQQQIKELEIKLANSSADKPSQQGESIS